VHLIGEVIRLVNTVELFNFVEGENQITVVS
jgi:hypothetical protein